MKSPGIAAFVATQLYVDLLDKPGWEISKFAVYFDDPDAILRPEHVTSIDVCGPDGYVFSIEPKRKLGEISLNGYVPWLEPGLARPRRDQLWYMAFDKSGPLSDGEYRVTVTYSNGETASRTNKVTTNHEIVPVLREHRDAFTFDAVVSDDNQSVSLLWSTLKELAGMDAYYCTRIGERGIIPAVTHDSMLLVDDILNQSEEDPYSGLNSSRFDVDLRTYSARKFVWFVEILDSNKLEDINLGIFLTTHSFNLSSDSAMSC